MRPCAAWPPRQADSDAEIPAPARWPYHVHIVYVLLVHVCFGPLPQISIILVGWFTGTCSESRGWGQLIIYPVSQTPCSADRSMPELPWLVSFGNDADWISTGACWQGAHIAFQLKPPAAMYLDTVAWFSLTEREFCGAGLSLLAAGSGP